MSPLQNIWGTCPGPVTPYFQYQCTTMYIYLMNCSPLYLPRYCSLLDNPGQCSSSPNVDCTRLSAGLITFLDENQSDSLFISTNQCMPDVKNILFSLYNTTTVAVTGSDEGYYTNCTASLTSRDGCNMEVFLLEGITVSSDFDFTSYTSQVQSECGVLDITCCEQEYTFTGKLI